MKNFQLFNTRMYLLMENFIRHGNSGVETHRMKRREFYKKVNGFDSDEELIEYETEKSKLMNHRLVECEEDINKFGSVYEIDESVRRYIIMNDVPSDKSLYNWLRLPFKTIFIETEFLKQDGNLGVENIKGIMITERKGVEDEHYFVIYYMSEDEIEGGRFWIDEMILSLDAPEDLKILYDDNKTMRFIKKFMINFLLFIHDPEVEYIIHKRGEKNRDRRISQGKMPLPNSRKVVLKGELRKYMGLIKDSLGSGYNHRFWVSGHYRTFEDDRYTKMKGKTIKIEPFIKGSGILVKRPYHLKRG